MPGLLNISEAMSIALHTCAWLADECENFQPARIVAEHFGFSTHHFAKVVQQLARAGILETERGPAGGCRLAHPPSSLTLLDIYVAAGGSPNYNGCLLHHDICKGDGCILGQLISDENQRILEMLKSITLDTVVKSLKQSKVGANKKESA